MSVSVVVPCYNEPSARVRETVRSALAASCDEVVLVDDGSETSIELAEARVVRTEHRGIAHALNTGTKAARGDYLCWLSVGDTMRTNKIRQQYRFMRELGSAASFHDYVNGKGASGVFRSRPKWREKLETDNQFCGSTAMVLRDVALGCPWDESLTYAVDWDWACRVEFDGPGWDYLQEVLGAAFELPGGHTMTAEATPDLWAKKCKDRLVVHKRWRRANRIARKTAK